MDKFSLGNNVSQDQLASPEAAEFSASSFMVMNGIRKLDLHEI